MVTVDITGGSSASGPVFAATLEEAKATKADLSGDTACTCLRGGEGRGEHGSAFVLNNEASAAPSHCMNLSEKWEMLVQPPPLEKQTVEEASPPRRMSQPHSKADGIWEEVKGIVAALLVSVVLRRTLSLGW